MQYQVSLLVLIRSSMDNKERVQWCLKKAKEALADYNQQEANEYLELAEMWLRKV